MRWKESHLPAHIWAQVAVSRESPKAAHKYGAKEVWVDSIRFGSRLEAEHYQQLKLLKAASLIRYFTRQVRFDLGGGVRHFVDWMVVCHSCEPLFADSKGVDTAMGRAKRKLVKDRYGIDIVLWKTKQVAL